MKIMKVFPTSEMPQEIWEYLYANELVQIDGHKDYTIGYSYGEAMKEAKQNPENKDYYEKQAANSKMIDDYFIANGAEANETVLINH
jgi:hypothetical protein